MKFYDRESELTRIRKDSEFFHLGYLPIKTQKDILTDHNLYSGENLLYMFSIFDVIPRFYEEIIDTGETDFKNALRQLIVDNH